MSNSGCCAVGSIEEIKAHFRRQMKRQNLEHAIGAGTQLKLRNSSLSSAALMDPICS